MNISPVQPSALPDFSPAGDRFAKFVHSICDTMTSMVASTASFLVQSAKIAAGLAGGIVLSFTPAQAQSDTMPAQSGHLIRISDADANTIRDQHRALGADMRVAREIMAQVVQPIGRAIMSGDIPLAEKLIAEAQKPGGAAETLSTIRVNAGNSTVALTAVAIHANGSAATTPNPIALRGRQQRLAETFRGVTSEGASVGSIDTEIKRLNSAREASEAAWRKFDPSTVGGADGTTLTEAEAMDLAKLAINAQIATENIDNAAFFLTTGAKRWLLKKTAQSAIGDGTSVDPSLLPDFGTETH